MKKCPYCAELIEDDAKKCRFCGEWLEKAQTNEKIEIKNPTTALILSLIIPGVGQIYNGQKNKGIVCLLLFIFLFWTIIVPIVVWIYSFIDAYDVAQKINSGVDLNIKKDSKVRWW